MIKSYNLAAFGYGGMAGIHIDKVLSKYDRVNTKGVFDIDPARMEAAKNNGHYTYSSKDELLNDKDVDIVLVSTTNDCHKELCIDALLAGKNVICEKPVTTTAKDLIDIIEVAKKTGKVFSINQNRRVNKDFVLMRRKVEEGLLGKVYHIESRVEGSRGMPEGWRTQKEKGGGMMLDWGVHLIDQIMYMIDEKVVNVFCRMYSVHFPEIDDNFRMIMTFESGLTALIEVSTNNFISHPRWYVLGTDATLQIDGWDCEGKIVKPIQSANNWGVEIVSTKAGPSKTMAPRAEQTLETIHLHAPSDVEDSLLPMYNQFVDKLENKAELTITPEQALRVVRVMEAAFESAKTGRAIITEI